MRGTYARTDTDTKRDRPGKFTREDLLQVASRLRDLLARETSIEVRSFVGPYLLILKFPRDLREALKRGVMHLFEAHLLARLIAHRLGSTEKEARAPQHRDS